MFQSLGVSFFLKEESAGDGHSGIRDFSGAIGQRMRPGCHCPMDSMCFLWGFSDECVETSPFLTGKLVKRPHFLRPHLTPHLSE